jgi:hypothetical protein
LKTTCSIIILFWYKSIWSSDQDGTTMFPQPPHPTDPAAGDYY